MLRQALECAIEVVVEEVLMGQSITVEVEQADGFCVFTTDRSLSGQDGGSFDSAAAAEGISGIPAEVARKLFASDDQIEHVYVASNDVIVKRSSDWDDTAIGDATRAIEGLFRFYAD